jgi:hypothetical protein
LVGPTRCIPNAPCHPKPINPLSSSAQLQNISHMAKHGESMANTNPIAVRGDRPGQYTSPKNRESKRTQKWQNDAYLPS